MSPKVAVSRYSGLLVSRNVLAQKKLESEFWNHKMVRSDIDGYTARFHELCNTPILIDIAAEANLGDIGWGTNVPVERCGEYGQPFDHRWYKDGIFKKKENAGNKKRSNDHNRNRGRDDRNKRQRTGWNFALTASEQGQGKCQYAVNIQIYRERPKGNLKQLKTMKMNELKHKDIRGVYEFPGVFLEDLSGLPLSREVEFRIDLNHEAMPVAKSPYRLTPMKMQELSNQLKELQEKCFIRPSSSPWGALVMFVKKKDGSFFMCIEYRELNKLTIKNRNPLPRIDDMFDQLYSQNCIQDEAVSKKSFIVFIDDVLICSKSKEEHEVHLKLILELFEKEKLFGKFLKCEFWIQEVPFLGHVVNSEGVDDFVVYCDASNQGFGCVLMQRNKDTGSSERSFQASKGVNTPAKMLKGLDKQFERKEDGGLYLAERIWVPVYGNLRTLIINEAYATRYFVHPGEDKMYYDL
nr:putative reverse transcriptase domain-containing protein [Tanacetum cinerariifolium]